MSTTIYDYSMPVRITFPDGAHRDYQQAPTGLQIAEDISGSLLRKALAIRVDGELRDLAGVVESDAEIEIVTRDHDEGLELLRHDAAHVMAEAVKELYPETQVTIGPAIEDGFYYDFARPDPFTPEDLEQIEARMRDIVDRGEPIVREVWERDRAIDYFRGIREVYKAEIIESIDTGETLTVYRQGAFVDL
ncbi:MAG: TGS domain-containing protein, partial [Gammaproteobacteria bacterium]|nr:TGS domain-containing protein [Gammaproteobacteria bacterium]